MPLVRLDIPADLSRDRAMGLADAVHDALVAKIGIPATDRFQIISRHQAADFMRDPHYPNLSRTDAAVVVSITFRVGRTDAMKRDLYRAIVAGAAMRADLKPDDVMVVITENGPADWSFGGGIAIHAPEPAA